MQHTTQKDRLNFLSICCKDDEKGQERIGRSLTIVYFHYACKHDCFDILTVKTRAFLPALSTKGLESFSCPTYFIKIIGNF